MEKKNKIQLATFFGLGFWAMGLKGYSTTFNGTEGAFLQIVGLIYVALPFIGTLLLSYVAGELYKGK